MTLKNTLRSLGKMVNIDTETARRRQLSEELQVLYCDKAQEVAQFTAHAQRMYYPHFRDRLLRIAAEESAHVSWLRHQLVILNGDAPKPHVNPRFGRNSWECLLLDLEKEKHKYAHLIRKAARMPSITPHLAEGLQRLCDDERRHHEELQEMWMKSDPYTPLMPKTSHPELEQQKQEWIERRKGAWFARERTEWKKEGQPVEWGEWEGELEKRWTVNELPSLDLIWKRKVAKEELERAEQVLKTSPSYSDTMTASCEREKS